MNASFYRRIGKIGGAFLAVSMLATGCGNAPTSDDEKSGNELPVSVPLAGNYDEGGSFSFAYPMFVSSWDPIGSAGAADMVFYDQVFDRLFRQMPDGSLEPMLATKYEASDDLTSLTLTLRKNLTYSDGTAFDAESVKFNLERYQAKGSKIAGEISQISAVEVIDPSTVKITVTDKLGALPAALADRPGVMISPAAVAAGTAASQPVGIGPYTATAIVPGNSVTLERTKGYWDPDAQHVAVMTYREIVDDQARFNAVVSGDIDAAQLSPDRISAALKTDRNVVSRPSSAFVAIVLNTDHAAFSDPEVRKAINMVIDRDGIATGGYDGRCSPGIQPFVEGTVGFNDQVGDGAQEFPFDPQQAKKVLDKKGMTGTELSATVPNIPIYEKVGEAVQYQLKQVGITLDLKIVPPPEGIQQFALDHSTDMAVWPYTGVNDPDGVFNRFISPTALLNPSQSEYPEMDALFTEGASQVDPAKRAKAYSQAMDAWVENPPHLVPICQTHAATIFNDRVSNLTQRSGAGVDLRGVAVTNS